MPRSSKKINKTDSQYGKLREIKNMFSIDKYKFAFFNDVNGKQTVSARSTYAGKTVKGYAKCDPRDEFDVEKGKELAAARCNARIAEKRFKRAQKKVAEAQAMVEMAQKYLVEMESYLADAANDMKDANDYVADMVSAM